MNDVTLIIERIRGGDAGATDELLPIVYNELRRMAGRKLDAEAGHPTIQTTELVHEAYLRLVGTDQSWDCRAHFLAAAAEAMRRILVERARRRGASGMEGAAAASTFMSRPSRRMTPLMRSWSSMISLTIWQRSIRSRQRW